MVVHRLCLSSLSEGNAREASQVLPLIDRQCECCPFVIDLGFSSSRQARFDDVNEFDACGKKATTARNNPSRHAKGAEMTDGSSHDSRNLRAERSDAVSLIKPPGLRLLH